MSRKQLELSQQSAQQAAEAQRRTLELTEQSQVTDRYTRAIEQLGSGQLDVRIGGVYALERIARDSARDHPTVMEVLAAFIREHSREPWPIPESDSPPAPEPFTRPDVQAALTVIARRDARQDRERIDLTKAVLPRALLFDANLTHVRLVAADLRHAVLSNADLSRARLGEADLTRADLTGANLTGARLPGAILTDATLAGANLTGSDLGAAVLVRAHLTDTQFADADLTMSNLSGARLTLANMTGANLADANLAYADIVIQDPSQARTLHGADLTDATITGPMPEGWLRDPQTGRTRSRRDDETA